MSDKASAERMIAEGAPKVRDPHHNGFSFWSYWNRKFWHRSGTSGDWTEVKKIHPTPARIKVLAWLIGETHD